MPYERRELDRGFLNKSKSVEKMRVNEDIAQERLLGIDTKRVCSIYLYFLASQ